MEQETELFTSNMKKWQYAVVLLYMPIHCFGLPLLLAEVSDRAAMSLGMANFWHYAASAAFLLLVLWNFLRRELDPLLDRFFLSLLEILRNYIAIWCCGMIIQMFLLFLGVSGDSVNNEQAIELLHSERGPMIAASVFVAPLAEECLFRGGLFGVLRKKNRTLAYAASAAVFGAYHIWSAALADPRELIFLLEYIPAGLLLARCYEHTDSLWGSIFLHMLNNGIALWAVTGG